MAEAEDDRPPLASTGRDAREDEPPPFLGRWSNVYLLVIGELALLTILFFLLGRWAS